MDDAEALGRAGIQTDQSGDALCLFHNILLWCLSWEHLTGCVTLRGGKRLVMTLDFGHSIWVDGGATSWNGKELWIGNTVEIRDSFGKTNSGTAHFVYLILSILNVFHEHRLFFHAEHLAR